MIRIYLACLVMCCFCMQVNAQFSDSIKKLVPQKELNNPTYYGQLADSLKVLGRSRESVFVLKQAMLLKAVKETQLLQAKINLALGDIYNDINEYRLSINYYNKSMEYFEKLNDVDFLIKNYVRIQDSYFRLVKIDSALLYLNKAVVLCEKDPEKYARYLKIIYNSYGLMYSAKSNLPLSLSYYYKVIDICHKTKDVEGLFSTYNNLGMFYSDREDYRKGLRFYFKALAIKYSAPTLANISSVYENLNNNDSAYVYIKKAIAIDLKNDDKEGLASNYTVLGNIFRKMNFLDSVYFYYSLSDKYANIIGDMEIVQNNNYNIVEILISEKKYAQAKLLAEKNSLSVLAGNDLLFKEEICDQLKTIYENLGEYKKAYEYQSKFIQYKDSVQILDKSIELERIELNAEYKMKASNDSLLHIQEALLRNVKHEAEIKKQSMILIGFILILVIVATFSIFIYKRYKVSVKQREIIRIQKDEMFSQKLLVEEKQKEIVDSINYAKRIQYTLLAHEDFLKEHLPQHFIFYNPKDIVSGDFYWATKKDNKFYFAVCDSTGHGVPGAFMSLLNIGFLSEAINEKNIDSPNEVFNYARKRLCESVSRDGQKDGFDGILVCLDLISKKITYSAANNKPLFIRKGEYMDLATDKMPVGAGERFEDFKLYSIDTAPGDILYLYTDGYADQFGGPKGKKFKYKPLNDLILENHHLSMQEQKSSLQSSFNSWRGDLEQVDDVCVMCIKF